MLDLKDPRRVVARTPDISGEPQAYSEMSGLSIPNMIFPAGSIVKHGLPWIYYGCCDTAISLATVRINDLTDHIPPRSRIDEAQCRSSGISPCQGPSAIRAAR